MRRRPRLQRVRLPAHGGRCGHCPSVPRGRRQLVIERDASDDVREHIRRQYAGVFTDAAIERHVDERVGMDAAHELLAILQERRPDARRILDVGSGYGSFVLAARETGLEAVGLEPVDFELGWARGRLAEERPNDDPGAVYVQGDAGALPFPAESFDAVTLWNVLEHVPDGRLALSEAARVLRPGGSVFVLAPNYAAFRREAHYHVPWPPLLPKRLAAVYLRTLGRDPAYFADAVHPCTKLATVRRLQRLGFELREPRIEKLDDPSRVERPLSRAVLAWAKRLRLLGALRLALRARMLNPLSPAIFLEAVKRS